MRTAALLFAFLLSTIAGSCAISSDDLLLAGRHLYRDTDARGRSGYRMERDAIRESGHRHAFFTDVGAGISFIYAIDDDSIAPTDLTMEEFAAEQGFDPGGASVAMRFLVVKFHAGSDAVSIDVGASPCHGFLAAISTAPDTGLRALRPRVVKCCF